jgi:hypothetical protein
VRARLNPLCLCLQGADAARAPAPAAPLHVETVRRDCGLSVVEDRFGPIRADAAEGNNAAEAVADAAAGEVVQPAGAPPAGRALARMEELPGIFTRVSCLQIAAQS